MKRSTLMYLLALISLNLLWMSTPALAQHGGSHGGGGGGGRAGGSGGFHGGGGSYGGPHGGAYAGGYGGGYHGGEGAGAYAGRGSVGGMRGEASGARASNAGRPWSWEGHSSRDVSPGWHQFASGSSNTARGAGGATAARSGQTSVARAGLPSHAAVADGNWHSFNTSARTAEPTSRAATVIRSTVFTNNFGGRSNVGVWRGGWRGGWGWGWPGWNWGWGWGWNWGLGFGWGWGWWGPGWSAWGPFWAWPPYYYDPWFDDSWLYGDSPAPYVLDPYPA